MMSSVENGMREVSSGAAHVGAELRAARERLGWSLPAVADNLRIRHAYLLALEEGRLSDLPAVAYAVGFLRAYANLLGLDADELSSRLRADTAHRKTELEFPAPVPERGVPAGAVVLLGVVLAIGAYVGWYRMSGEGPGTPPVQAVPDRLATLAGTAPASMPRRGAGLAVSPYGSASATAAQARPATANSVLPAPEVPPSSAAVPPPGAAVLPAAVLPAIGATVSPVATPEPPQGTSSGPFASAMAANAPATVPPPTADSRMEVRAHADAWVQVRDQKGQVLLNRVLRAGESWPVPPQPAGQPPLLLTTGNAGGTDLVVGGVVAAPIGSSGAVRRDLPLDPESIRQGKLEPQVAAAKPAPAHPQPLQQ